MLGMGTGAGVTGGAASVSVSAGGAAGATLAGGQITGTVSVNALPPPSTLSTVISPPRSRARSREMDRPRPVPPYFLCVLPSA